MSAAPPSLARQRILAILEELYPCKRTAWGVYRQIARDVGVSPQRVRQIAAAAGWSAAPPQEPAYQCICGRVQKSATLCQDCRYVDLPCEQCGTLRRVSIAQLVWKVSRYVGDLQYTGRVFCGRACFGRWTGSGFNGLRRKERLARLYAILLERYPDDTLPAGACVDLADELGVMERWVRQHAAMLGWERSS